MSAEVYGLFTFMHFYLLLSLHIQRNHYGGCHTSYLQLLGSILDPKADRRK